MESGRNYEEVRGELMIQVFAIAIFFANLGNNRLTNLISELAIFSQQWQADPLSSYSSNDIN